MASSRHKGLLMGQMGLLVPFILMKGRLLPHPVTTMHSGHTGGRRRERKGRNHRCWKKGRSRVGMRGSSNDPTGKWILGSSKM